MVTPLLDLNLLLLHTILRCNTVLLSEYNNFRKTWYVKVVGNGVRYI